MAKAEKKGTVTSLASLFPPDEARKASQRVLDTLVEHERELHQLNQFVSDNNNVIDLVQRLPEQLHHDIMVINSLNCFVNYVSIGVGFVCDYDCSFFSPNRFRLVRRLFFPGG